MFLNRTILYIMDRHGNTSNNKRKFLIIWQRPELFSIQPKNYTITIALEGKSHKTKKKLPSYIVITYLVTSNRSQCVSGAAGEQSLKPAQNQVRCVYSAVREEK
ncbi:unnamed protein product [Nezara viridula]|uniref:Uncharacterized protein n=1 Tax=Nezara viridula TaxID=85310 RepID=A0A9P0E6X7_NEZVI|nr:unnamed protein product [Nezara viridula]